MVACGVPWRACRQTSAPWPRRERIEGAAAVLQGSCGRGPAWPVAGKGPPVCRGRHLKEPRAGSAPGRRRSGAWCRQRRRRPCSLQQRRPGLLPRVGRPASWLAGDGRSACPRCGHAVGMEEPQPRTLQPIRCGDPPGRELCGELRAGLRVARCADADASAVVKRRSAWAAQAERAVRVESSTGLRACRCCGGALPVDARDGEIGRAHV